MKPFSWFSDIADKFGISVWWVVAAAVVVSFLALNLLGPCSGGGVPCSLP